MFESHKPIIVNLKPMFELETHNWDLFIYVCWLFVHMACIILYKHGFESQIVGFKMSDYETYDRNFKTHVRTP